MLAGANGQVGWELHRTLLGLGQVIPFTRQNLDLTNSNLIRETVRSVKPDLIVNAAAYTAVDRAESEPDSAIVINGVAPGILAEEAKRINACFVHFSTDYVFDGTQGVPYRENDLPNPLSVYGRTKLAGEQAIQNTGAEYLILRTSWVYGLRGKNFLLTMLRFAQDREELRIVDDQVGAPTWSRIIAVMTTLILERCMHRDSQNESRVILDGKSGIYHLCAQGKTSWYGFASKIFEGLAHNRTMRIPKLTPILAHEYPLPAARPQNSQLDNRAVHATFRINPVSWDEALSLCLRDIEEHCGV